MIEKRTNRQFIKRPRWQRSAAPILAAVAPGPAGRIAAPRIILGSGPKIFKGTCRVAEMIGKRRSRPAAPASSGASKTSIASGARPRAPKQPKLKRLVQKNQNRGLEEALLKIAEIWQDIHTPRRRRRHRGRAAARCCPSIPWCIEYRGL